MISFFSSVFAAVGAAIIMAFAPVGDLISPLPPACVLTVTSADGTQTTGQDADVSIKEGESIDVAWTSAHARSAQTPLGVSIALTGSAHYTPTATSTYSYIFSRGDAQMLCSATVNVVVPAPVATSTPSFPVAPVKKPAPPPVVVPPPPPPVVQPPPPPIATTTQNIVVGDTTLAVASIPLLTGGTAHAGQTVPVAYLQITNTGKEYALLKGFTMVQNGSASTNVVIGLSTVDDQGGSRGLAGGQEGLTPFKNGSGYAPTSAYFAPGQMRLFTVKAILTANTSAFAGTNLMLDVASLDSSAAIRGTFPIRGTTWTIAP